VESRVLIHPNQQVTDTDLNNVGEFARASLDHVVNDGIEPGRRFWGFPVTATGPLEVTVGAGRFYNQGAVFFRNDDGGVVLNLADYIPVVTKKIVTVVVWGNLIETDVEPRTFLVDAETGQTEAEAVATESRRHAEINVVPGTENANPQPPALDASVLAVAHVTLTPSGIESIQMVESNRLSSVAGNTTAIKELQVWRDQAGTRIDTLDTELAGLSARLKGTIRRAEFFELGADVARIKDQLNMSDDLSSYGADHFLDLSETDYEHPDYLAKTEEGIRFAHAQERVANINLLNPLEDRLSLTGNFAIPAYDPVARISIVGRDGEVPISQYPINSVTMQQLTRTRTRLRYGSVMTVCTNSDWWKSGRYDPIKGTFERAGETFQVLGTDYSLPVHGGGQHFVRIQQVWEDTFEEAYWEAQVTTDTINGAVIGETWLNAQDGWVTHIDLFFTQVASSGDVRVVICETTNGAPDLGRVLAQVTVPQANLKTYPQATNIPIGPVYVTKGRRYATVLITQGAHVVAYVQGNKYAQGQIFYSGDGGAWFMGDATRDLSMVVYYAQFRATRAEVQIQPFQLENGIGAVDIIAESFIPDGCELIWQVQQNGVWRSLNSTDTNALNGLPALLNARLVFVGTTDLMPCITFGAASTVTTFRCRTDFTHVSTVRTMPVGVTVDDVEVRLRLEGWDPARHTCDCELLTGAGFATPLAASSYEDRPTEDPNAIERRFFFEPSPAIDAYKIKIEGTTDNALVTFHVAERIDLARASS